MDNYEVNVLTRKGGWKKLPQEVIQNKDELKLNNSDNLNINVTEDNLTIKTLSILTVIYLRILQKLVILLIS